MDFGQRVNAVFECLAHRHRRKTVAIVTEKDEPITIDELASEIATRSDSSRSSGHDPDSAETIHIELYHRHLPKLAEADLIDYDRTSNRISSRPATTHLTALVQIAYSIVEET